MIMRNLLSFTIATLWMVSCHGQDAMGVKTLLIPTKGVDQELDRELLDRDFFVYGKVAEKMEMQAKRGESGSYVLKNHEVKGLDKKVRIRIDAGYMDAELTSIETFGTKRYAEVEKQLLAPDQIPGYKVTVTNRCLFRKRIIDTAQEERAFVRYLDEL